MSMSTLMLLDNVGKCATLLPEDDPLRRDSRHQLQLRKHATTIKTQPASFSSSSTKDTSSNKRPRNNNNANNNNIHPFEAIASHLDSGPHSILYRLRNDRKRVRIVVRYVNMVRGTVTGTLMAFDKHMNMILRDVEEVYSPRLVDDDNERSNLELELERRRRIRLSLMGTAITNTNTNTNTTTTQIMAKGSTRNKIEKESLFDDNNPNNNTNSNTRYQHQHQPGTWNVRRRQMKQLLVRGDMVVSIYEAGPAKDKNTGTAVAVILKSRYHKRTSTSTSTSSQAIKISNHQQKEHQQQQQGNIKPCIR